MATIKIPGLDVLGKALAKQILPEGIAEAGVKAAGEAGESVAPRLPEFVLRGEPRPEPTLGESAVSQVRQNVPPTTRIQQLDPIHAEDAAKIELSPAYMERIKELGGGKRVSHDETWAKALNGTPMTVEELAQWKAGGKVNEVDVARAGLLRTRMWEQYHDAIMRDDDMTAMELEKVLESIEPGYNNLTATGPRATEFQKVFQEYDSMQARVRQLRAANIPYSQVKEEIDALVRDARASRTRKPLDDEQTLLDKIEVYATAAKLTSPITHVVNTVSNSLTFAQRAAEKYGTAAWLDMQGRPYEAEAMRAHAWGTRQGFIDGTRKFLDAYSGIGDMPGSKIEFSRPRKGIAAEPWENVGIGEKTKRTLSPFRLLEAADNFWKAVIYDSEISTHAFAQARKEGLADEMFAARVKWLAENPPEPWKESAWQTAMEYTYQDDPGRLVKALQKIQSVPGGKLLIPFIRTPANILRFHGRRSPLGLLSQKNIADWKAGGIRRAEVTSRLGVGTAMMAGALALYMHGQVTGAYPADPRERALWEQEGRIPWSIRVGNHWLTFDRAQPIGLYMSDVAALGEALKENKFKEGQDLAEKLAYQFLRGPMEINFLQGMSALFDTLQDPERSAKKFGTLLATGFVPNILRDVRLQTDPQLRKPTTIVEAVENMMPGLSQEVVPKVTVLGQVKETEEDRLLRAFKQTSKSMEDQTTEYLRDLGWAPMPAPLTLSVRGVRKEIDKDNREAYLKEMGEVTMAAIQAVMNDPRVQPLDTPLKRRVVARVVEAARQPIERKYQILLGLYGPEAQAEARGGQ